MTGDMNSAARGFFVYSMIAVAVLLGFVLRDAGVFTHERTEKGKSEILTTEADIASWKTYRNEEYGFEVKYPENFMEDELKNGGMFSITDATNISHIEFFIEDPQKEPYWPIKKHLEEREFSEENIDGILWYTYTLESDAELVRYIQDRNGVVFVFSANLSDEKNLRKILSTFKFTEQTSKTLSPGMPSIVKTLCESGGNVALEKGDGTAEVFRGGSATALRCKEGAMWIVTEGPIPEGAEFYFDGAGSFLDICQRLFAPSKCVGRYRDVPCEEKDYCIE